MPDVPTWQLVLLGVLATIQIALMIVALVRLFRTPTAQLSAPRVVWFLVCFVQFAGPIAFLLFGRRPTALADPVGSAPAERTQQVVDELYGDKEER